jgi:hypothetical protein
MENRRSSSHLLRIRIAKSLLRIAAAVPLVLAVLVAFLALAITQPSFWSLRTKVPHRVNPQQLQKHVEFLCNQVPPRNCDNPEVLKRAAKYIADAFERSGGRVERQVFRAGKGTYENVVASFGPKDGARLIIGAHYDVFGNLPGADDNASGVAVLLELGRLLGQVSPTERVDLVAFSLEEPPFFGSEKMGSAVHARSLRESRRPIKGMISIEMVGYFSSEQNWNNWLLSTIYPTRGNFVMIVARWQDRDLSRYVNRSFRGASSLPVRTFIGPSQLTVDASDHLSYWNNGYSAVMVTDTAYIRNHNYHTARDTSDTLDYGKMALVVDGLYGIAHQADKLEGRVPK